MGFWENPTESIISVVLMIQFTFVHVKTLNRIFISVQ